MCCTQKDKEKKKKKEWPTTIYPSRFRVLKVQCCSLWFVTPINSHSHSLSLVSFCCLQESILFILIPSNLSVPLYTHIHIRHTNYVQRPPNFAFKASVWEWGFSCTLSPHTALSMALKQHETTFKMKMHCCIFKNDRKLDQTCFFFLKITINWFDYFPRWEIYKEK